MGCQPSAQQSSKGRRVTYLTSVELFKIKHQVRLLEKEIGSLPCRDNTERQIRNAKIIELEDLFLIVEKDLLKKMKPQPEVRKERSFLRFVYKG